MSTNGKTMQHLVEAIDAWHVLYEETGEDREAWRELAMVRGEQLERAGIQPVIRAQSELFTATIRELTTRFDKDEVDMLAQDIGIKPDNLRGDTLDTRARSLVVMADQRHTLAQLINRIREERPLP